MTESGLYVGILSDDKMPDFDDNIAAHCVEKIREGYDVVVGFFSHESEDFYNIFKFCFNNDLPIVSIHRKYSNNLEEMNIESIMNQLNAHDFLYSDDYEVVMISKKSLKHIVENMYGDISGQKFINTMNTISKHLTQNGFNVDKINL